MEHLLCELWLHGRRVELTTWVIDTVGESCTLWWWCLEMKCPAYNKLCLWTAPLNAVHNLNRNSQFVKRFYNNELLVSLKHFDDRVGIIHSVLVDVWVSWDRSQVGGSSRIRLMLYQMSYQWYRHDDISTTLWPELVQDQRKKINPLWHAVYYFKS